MLVRVFAVLCILGVVLLCGCSSSEEKLPPLEDKKIEIELLVTAATDAIEMRGTEMFSEFRSSGSDWYHDDTYVFVWETSGMRVVYPPDSRGEGQDMSMLEDVNGKPIGQLFIEVATTEPYEGWVSYVWPKPGTEAPVEKETHIMRAEHGDTTYLVGAGIYLDEYES